MGHTSYLTTFSFTVVTIKILLVHAQTRNQTSDNFIFFQTQAQLVGCGEPGAYPGPIGPLPLGPSCSLNEAQFGPRNLPGPINEFLLNSLNGPVNPTGPFGPFPGTLGNGPFINIQDCPLNVPVESPCRGRPFIEDVQLNVPCGPLSEPVWANSLGINRDLKLKNLFVNEITGPLKNPGGPCGPFNRPFNGPLSLEYINSLESVPVFNIPQEESCECAQDVFNPYGGPLRPNFNYVSPVNRPNCLLPQPLSENIVSSAINRPCGTLYETVIENEAFCPLYGSLTRPCGSQRETIIENLPLVNPSSLRPCGIVTESIIENIPVVNNIATSFNRPCGFVQENSIDLATMNPFCSPYSKPCGSKFEKVPTINPFGPLNRPCGLSEALIEKIPSANPLIGPFNRPCGPKIETVIENIPTMNPFGSPFKRPCGLPESLIENVSIVNPLIGSCNRPCGPKIETVTENNPTINLFASPFKRPCGLPEPLIENIPIVNPLIGTYNRPCGPKIETVIENIPAVNPFASPFNRPCGLPEPLIENIPTVNPLIGPYNRPCGPKIETVIENVPTVNSLPNRLTGCFRPLSEQIIENVPLNQLNPINPCSRPKFNSLLANEPCVSLPKPFNNIPTINPLGPISESCSSIPRPFPNFNAPVLETRSYSPINPGTLPSITCTPPTIPLTSTITPSIVNSSPLISPTLTDNSLTASLANSLQLLLYTNLLESYNEAVNGNNLDTICFPSVSDRDCFAPNIGPCETVETIVSNPYGGFTDIVTTVNADPYNVRPNLCGDFNDLNPLSPELINLAELGAVPPNMVGIAERVSPLAQNLLADAIRQQNAVPATNYFDPIQNSFDLPCNALPQNNFNNLGALELINLVSQNQIGIPDLVTLLLQKEGGLPNDQYLPPFDIPGVNPPNVFGLPEFPAMLSPFLPIEAPQNAYGVPEFVPLSPIDPIYPPPCYCGYESPPFNPIPSPPPIPITPLFGYTESYTPYSLDFNPFTSIVAEDVSSSLQNYYAEVVSPMAEILIPSEIPAQLVCSFDCSALPGVILGV